MTEFELTTGFGGVAVREMLAFVGGVTPPVGPPGVVTLGVVGVSALQPAKITSNARSAKIRFRCLILIMSTPVNSSIHPRRQLSAPAAREAEIECHSRVAGNAFAGECLTK